MNTFYNNLVAAGATVREVPNGTCVELLGHTFIFTEKKMGLWGDGNGGYCSIPFAYKRPVVLVEIEYRWNKLWDLRSRIPLDGTKYKVFV